MRQKELFFSAVNSLWYYRSRSLLTLLGVVVGIAAIIITMAIGADSQRKLATKILSMGNNYLYIYRGSIRTGRKVAGPKNDRSKVLTLKDIQAIAAQVSGIAAISPMTITRQTVSFNNNNLQIDVKSGNSLVFNILNRQLDRGTLFFGDHCKNRSRVIVLGAKIAQELFGCQSPINQTVKIEGQNFVVIGTLKPIETFFGASDPNNDCFVPFLTAKYRLLREKNKNVSGIAISIKPTEHTANIIQQIRHVLRASHQLNTSADDDFSFVDQESIAATAKASMHIITLLLFAIASICLLIGSIGITNIMLICVAERTREIGIRMAIGALKRHILLQFLYEAMLLSGCGGLCGIVVGLLIKYCLSRLNIIQAAVEWQPVALAATLTFVIGVVAGIYPANKAAKLKPSQALFER